jgi:hypothetical protein
MQNLGAKGWTIGRASLRQWDGQLERAACKTAALVLLSGAVSGCRPRSSPWPRFRADDDSGPVRLICLFDLHVLVHVRTVAIRRYSLENKHTLSPCVPSDLSYISWCEAWICPVLECLMVPSWCWLPIAAIPRNGSVYPANGQWSPPPNPHCLDRARLFPYQSPSLKHSFLLQYILCTFKPPRM